MLILGMFGAIAILVRPSEIKTAPPAINADTVDGFHASATPTANTLLALDANAKFPNSVLYMGSGGGLNADLLDGIDSSYFVQQSQLGSYQRKIVTKHAQVGGGATPDTTPALPSAPVDMPGTTISFSAGEISGPTTLVINWAATAYNNTAGWIYGVETHLMVDGVEVAVTHISQPGTGGAMWVQHASNATAVVTAGSHTVNVKWNVFWDGGTGYVAERHLTVMAIPQ